MARISMLIRRLLLPTTCAVLAACGGGNERQFESSGRSREEAQAATSQSSLKLTKDNATVVSQVALREGEAMLLFAEMAVQTASAFTAGVPRSFSRSCSNGGLITKTLADNDHDNVASAGDGVTIKFRDCAAPLLNTVLTGTVTVELTAPSKRGSGNYAGLITSTLGVRPQKVDGATPGFLGSFKFESLHSDFSSSLSIDPSPSDDLALYVPTGKHVKVDSIHSPRISKTLRFDQARSIVTMSFVNESEVLGGRITVRTPDALLSYLTTQPDVGTVAITGGGGSRLSIKPNFVVDSFSYDIALDANGDDRPEYKTSAYWSNAILGFLWWDDRSLATAETPSYNPRAFASNDFYVSLVGRLDNGDWPVRGGVQVQFSRPLAQHSTFKFRFVEGSLFDTPLVEIPTEFDVRGAVAIVRPKRQLTHNTSYVLQMTASHDFPPDGQNVTVVDELNNKIDLAQGVLASETTPNNLIAGAAIDGAQILFEGKSLRLTAAGSSSAVRKIASYRWTQLSGPALTFSNPDGLATRVTIADAPVGARQARVQLQVTDSAGEVERAIVEFQVVGNEVASRELYFRSTAGDYIGGGQTKLYVTADGTFSDNTSREDYVSISFQTPGFSDYWSLDLATGNGSPLAVGKYEHAIRAPFRGHRNGLNFDADSRGCNELTGRFEVFEIDFNHAGKVIKLAADFEQHCESATAPPLFGSIRINSQRPIRR